jgi:outer membrane lipoprotein-sorting protein
MRSFVVLFAAVLLCPLARCADLDAIEADICNKWDSIKSMTYDMESSTNMATPQFSMTSNTTGTAEMKRKGDMWLMRMDSKGANSQTLGGKETKSESTTMMVIDGEYVYSLTDAGGAKMCTKMKAQDWTKMAGGKGYFKWLREENDVKVLPDETIDGVSCYALEATSKKVQPGQGSMKFCFSKDNGMTVLTVAKGPDGKVLTTSKIKNIKSGVALADDRFTFTPPAGVTVTDMTNAGNGTTSAPAEKQPATAKTEDPPAKTEAAPAKTETAGKPEKKEEPKKEEPKKEEPKKKRKIPGF